MLVGHNTFQFILYSNSKHILNPQTNYNLNLIAKNKIFRFQQLIPCTIHWLSRWLFRFTSMQYHSNKNYHNCLIDRIGMRQDLLYSW